MQEFIEKHQEDIVGVLSGLDRLVISGYLRTLCATAGVMDYLKRSGVMFKDFGTFVEQQTEQLKQASLAEARRLGRPIEYLNSPRISKEETAREIARRDQIREGLICVLSAVEPCMTLQMRRIRHLKQTELVRAVRKCLFLYHYWMDPCFGFMHARIQTWFPFTIRICLNGREWLARQMEAEGLKYQRERNCFLWLEDVKRAQYWMDRQLHTDWPQQCRRWAHLLNPAHEKIFGSYRIDYYWSAYQSEWATDVLFRSRQALARLYESLVRQAIIVFGSTDVLRFLGKRLYRFEGELNSDYRRRPEGLRIKHRLKANSIKMYDKAGQILRVETTINDSYDFRVYRRAETDPEGPLAWRRMRKGVADLYARCRFSHSCNERYLQALSDFPIRQPLQELLESVVLPRRWKKHRFRGLRPWSASDQALMQAVTRPEFQLRGFRNRDLLQPLFGRSTPDPRLSARITHRLRILRAHRLIHKIPHTHRYRLSAKGRQILPTLIYVYHLDTEQLTRLAA